MTPRTLDALRSAVARVLVARGEAPDALRVTCAWDRPGRRWHVLLSPTASGVEWEPMRGAASLKGDAIEWLWHTYVGRLEIERRAAVRSGAGIRRPERRAAAYQRIMRATAALTAARAVEAGE